jgi:hypothetical protein
MEPFDPAAKRLLHAYIEGTVGEPLSAALPAKGKSGEAAPSSPKRPLTKQTLSSDQYSGWRAILPERFRDSYLKETAEWKAVMALGPDERSQVARAGIGALRLLRAGRLALLAEKGPHLDTLEANARALRTVSSLVAALLKGKLKLTDADLTQLVSKAARKWPGYPLFVAAVPIVVALEKFCAATAPSEELCEACRSLQKLVGPGERAYGRLEKIIASRQARSEKAAIAITLEPGEPWSEAALSVLAGLPEEECRKWVELLGHCQGLSAAAPSKKWRDDAVKRVDAVGLDAFRTRIGEWFGLYEKTDASSPLAPYGINEVNDRAARRAIIRREHDNLLKGLAWCCGQYDDERIAEAVLTLGLIAYKKLPNIGPRSIKVGNAAIGALGAMPGTHGVGRLAVLRAKLKSPSGRNMVGKVIVAAAERLQISEGDLDELAVPAYGLGEGGVRRQTLAGFTIELAVVSSTSAELRFRRADGKALKSAPMEIRRNHASDLKDLKAAVKQIETSLGAHRQRLDTLFRRRKAWEYPAWRARYLDHPLLGTLARRLIWRFTLGDEQHAAIFHKDQLVTADDVPLTAPLEKSAVTLWHPLEEPRERVAAWREWLERHQVQQPFKQAHREIYALTDAERETRTYSNRFAAHIVRQHQMNALCESRGWRSRLLLLHADNAFFPPRMMLADWNLLAEFWVNQADAGESPSGVALHLATDQVRFYHAEREGGIGDLVPLEDVPPIVFSEVMRDVDLFVGVSSIGNDPTWRDAGPRGMIPWNTLAFGALTESGEVRKEVLERIVSRLQIADRCTFEKRFLVVRGDLRTYKIHLGSGNILMSPNNQYLCIVPDRSSKAASAGPIYLPFEGDEMLSIILSKALLLADDQRIKDPSIRAQIDRS